MRHRLERPDMNRPLVTGILAVGFARYLVLMPVQAVHEADQDQGIEA